MSQNNDSGATPGAANDSKTLKCPGCGWRLRLYTGLGNTDKRESRYICVNVAGCYLEEASELPKAVLAGLIAQGEDTPKESGRTEGK